MDHEISDTLWIYDDPRIDKLYKGELSVLGFLKASRPEDPWEMHTVKSKEAPIRVVLTGLSVEELEDREKKIRKRLAEHIAKTGGINGRTIYDRKDVFLKVFPELAPIFIELETEISREKCKGCALNKKTSRLVDALLAIPVGDRDLSDLEGILTNQGIARLVQGAALDETTVTIDIPYVEKKALPLRTAPREGERQVVSLLPGETPPWINTRTKKTPAPHGPSAKAPRPGCFDCCRKHLAQAIVLLGESLQGYPDHRWLAVGHLAEASEEILAKSVEIASQIRDERLAVMSDPSYIPNLMRFFAPVGVMAEEEKAGIA
jgi:hypothetical protein